MGFKPTSARITTGGFVAKLHSPLYGGVDETRTRDHRRDRPVFYQLNYHSYLVGARGVEPRTSCVSDKRSNQAELRTISYTSLEVHCKASLTKEGR